jgi:sulfide:quinone oxidoreductase
VARVLVLGGGFGGLAAANELRSILPGRDEIVLVSASDRFFMGFAKLWDLAGLRSLDQGTRPLAGLDGRGIRFVHAEVTALDPVSRTVSTTSGELTADALLVALGTVPSDAHLDLLAGRGHTLYDPEALPRMRAAIDGVVAGRVLIAILGSPFKCPPAPYEAALIVDERLRQRGVRPEVAVDVVTPQPMALPAAGPHISRVVAGYLAQQGIGLLERRVVSRIDGEGPMRRVEIGAEHLDCSVVLGVPAEKVPPVIEAGALTGPSGFIEPDPEKL